MRSSNRSWCIHRTWNLSCPRHCDCSGRLSGPGLHLHIASRIDGAVLRVWSNDWFLDVLSHLLHALLRVSRARINFRRWLIARNGNTFIRGPVTGFWNITHLLNGHHDGRNRYRRYWDWHNRLRHDRSDSIRRRRLAAAGETPGEELRQPTLCP